MYNIVMQLEEDTVPLMVVESEDLAEEIIEAISREYRNYFEVEPVPTPATRENTDIQATARNLEGYMDLL